jgi:hypothetical protein
MFWDEEWDQIIAEYAAGLDVAEIEQRHGVTRAEIEWLVAHSGGRPPARAGGYLVRGRRSDLTVGWPDPEPLAGNLMKVTALLGLVVLIILSATVTPFSLVTVVIWGLVVFCSRYTRRRGQPTRFEHQRDSAGLRYNLCAAGVLYLIPIGIAVSFYCLLAVYLRLFSGSASMGWLISVQRSFEAVSKFFSDKLKLTEVGVLAVLVGVYLLTCLLLWRRTSPVSAGPDTDRGWRLRTGSALNRGTDFYTRYSGPTAAGLATLAAFTFFGMQLGVPATDLRLRLKVAQEGYSEVTQQIEAELSQRVASGLYAKVYAGLPASYVHALTEQATAGDLVDDARKHVSDAKSTFSVSVPSVDKAVQEEAARRTRVEALDAKLRSTSAGRTDMPRHTTPVQVDAARSAIVDRAAGQGIDLIVDGRKKVTLQLEKVVSERILALTKPLIDAVPIMEPLIQAFADAADKTVQDRIGRAYDRLVGVALRNPDDLDAAIRQEAQAIVDQADVDKPVKDATPRAQRLAEARMQTLTSLRNAPALIDQKVTETLLARARARPARPLELPRLYEPPLSLTYPDWHYSIPELHSYRPPSTTYRLPPRPAVPPRPVRPPPRIFFW